MTNRTNFIATVIGAVALAMAGCAGGPTMTAEEAADAAYEAETCAAFDPAVVKLEMDRTVVRPGDAVKISAGFQPAPWSYERVETTCFDRWTLSNPAAATWSADHKTLTLSDGLRPGTLVVTGRLNGADVTLPIMIVARDAVVLTGQWGEESVSCADGFQPSQPVRELVFKADGSWSATYQPFESRYDVWGQGTFDPASKDLALAVESGNSIPANLGLSGTATVEGDRLTLAGFWLGEDSDRSAAGHVCRYVFARRG